MGTHPIFESDFDCLTAFATPNRQSRAVSDKLGTMLRLVVLIPLVFAIEQGKLEIKLEKDRIARIPKSLYKDAAVKLYMQLDCKDKEQEKVKVKFVMRSTTCLSEFTNMQPTTINCTNVVCYEVPGSFEWYYSHPE